MSTVQNTIFQTYKNVAEYFVPIATESQFHSTGTLTPDEFIQACDQLIQQTSTWQYVQHIHSDRVVNYLPADKQYIISRNVPSTVRANIYAKKGLSERNVESNDNDSWLSTHNENTEQPTSTNTTTTTDVNALPINNMSIDEDEIPDMQITSNPTQQQHNTTIQPQSNNDTQPPSFITSTTYLTATEPADTVLPTRTYDISIVYDKYYRTPRVYLFGYNENREPLTLDEIMDDISADYVYKTVTVETHPYTQIPTVSIHPCKHASVMKTICTQMNENIGTDGKPIQIDVKNYMLIFLKFIASVIPTIEYDYTQHLQ